MNDLGSSPFSQFDFWNDNDFWRAAAHDRQMDRNSPFKNNYMGNEFMVVLITVLITSLFPFRLDPNSLNVLGKQLTSTPEVKNPMQVQL